jgi:hypothetical protein
MSNVDSTLETKLVRISRYCVGEFSQSLSFVIRDAKNRLFEELQSTRIDQYGGKSEEMKKRDARRRGIRD